MLKKGLYSLVIIVSFITIIFFSESCNKDTEGINSPPTVDVTGTWNGIYSSSLVSSAQLTLILTQNGSTVSGTYTSSVGGVGTVSGNVESNTINNFVLTLTNPTCKGSFSGTAVVKGDTINFDFTGSDCWGTHTNGHGTVMRNTILPASDSIYIKIKLLNIPQTLTFNQSHVKTNHDEYVWGIFFNTDGNDTTGLFGFDIEVSIRHIKRDAAPFQASIINGTQPMILEWVKDSINYYIGYIKHTNFSVRIDPADHNTIVMAVPRSWAEISPINENVRFYINTYYIPPDNSYCQDETAVSSGTQLVSDPQGDVSYNFVDIVSGGWNIHSLMKKNSRMNLGINRNYINNKEQYWTGIKCILKHN